MKDYIMVLTALLPIIAFVLAVIAIVYTWINKEFKSRKQMRISIVGYGDRKHKWTA
jgi:hypothetical protein